MSTAAMSIDRNRDESQAKIYTGIKAVAKRLDLHRDTISEWMKSGDLRFHRKGKRTYLFFEDELVEDIKKGKTR